LVKIDTITVLLHNPEVILKTGLGKQSWDH